jgi:hypothetical protein
MSQPPQRDIDRLARVADDLREVFAERGHRVEVALEADRAFGSGASRSALIRDLARDAVSASASRNGVDFRPVNGSGRELRIFSGGVDRRYRFRRAHRESGRLFVSASGDSALAAVDETSLLTEEHWVFGYVASAEALIEEAFIAEVRGYVEGRPGHLVLGPETGLLSRPTPPPTGFTPSDEDLEGFEQDDEGESETGT